jgi:hypothetical protein
MPSNPQALDKQHYSLVRKHLGNIRQISDIFCALFFLISLMIKSSAFNLITFCTLAAEAHIIRNTTSDPCVAVCNEFSATRRGNGEELCNSPELSLCVNETSHGGVCTNLYWAVTDDGHRGLTYSTNWDDLSSEERSNPLGCLEAADIVPPAAIHDWTTSTTTQYPWQDDGAESMRLHAIAGGWPADWQGRVRRGTPSPGPVSTGNRANWAHLRTTTPRPTTPRPTTPPFGMGGGAEALRRHARAAGWPADWQERVGCANRAYLVSSTTTTRTPPSGMRRAANALGGSSGDYFDMYGTTPEPTHTL